MGICDLVQGSQRESGLMGGRRYPVIAVTAPKNDPKEQAKVFYLLLAMGLPAHFLRGTAVGQQPPS